MKRYVITFCVDDPEIKVRAKNKREAKKIARKKWRDGKVKVKLRHPEWTGYGTNIVVEEDTYSW